MKLYYSPGACSLAPHIALHEAGLPFDRVRTSTQTHRLEDGTDYYEINPRGYVPLLELDGGDRLTEAAVILQYIADLVPDKHLAPPAGTMARYRLMEWLNFISSELHTRFGPLFDAAMPKDAKKIVGDKLRSRLQWVDRQLAGRQFVSGDRFSVADAYLYTVARWGDRVGVPASGFPHIAAHQARIGERPAVKLALQHEGLG